MELNSRPIALGRGTSIGYSVELDSDGIEFAGLQTAEDYNELSLLCDIALLESLPYENRRLCIDIKRNIKSLRLLSLLRRSSAIAKC